MGKIYSELKGFQKKLVENVKKKKEKGKKLEHVYSLTILKFWETKVCIRKGTRYKDAYQGNPPHRPQAYISLYSNQVLSLAIMDKVEDGGCGGE